MSVSVVDNVAVRIVPCGKIPRFCCWVCEIGRFRTAGTDNLLNIALIDGAVRDILGINGFQETVDKAFCIFHFVFSFLCLFCKIENVGLRYPKTERTAKQKYVFRRTHFTDKSLRIIKSLCCRKNLHFT